MPTKKLLVVLIFVSYFVFSNSSTNLKSSDRSRILSRKRRYLTFPEGSSFSCAVCMTVGVIGQPAPITSPGMYTWGLNWGLAYELPNQTESLRLFHRLDGRRPIAQRRHRRELYNKLEVLMDSMGYDGRTCILKTLCECVQRFMPRGSNVIEEMFRTIFTFPIAKQSLFEPYEHSIYEGAQQLGRMMEDCDRKYYRCPLSLVDLVLGHYNAPSSNSFNLFDAMSLFKGSWKKWHPSPAHVKDRPAPQFSCPVAKQSLFEPYEHSIYEGAQQLGRMTEDCHRKYYRCPLSLVDLVLGRYNAPRSNSFNLFYAMSLFKGS